MATGLEVATVSGIVGLCALTQKIRIAKNKYGKPKINNAILNKESE